MDEQTFLEIESLLLEAKNRAQVVLDGYTVGQAGGQNAYFMQSNICKALAHLRALKAMNV